MVKSKHKELVIMNKSILGSHVWEKENCQSVVFESHVVTNPALFCKIKKLFYYAFLYKFFFYILKYIMHY